MADRFDYANENLDDVVVEDVTMFRLEYMRANSIWIKCYRDGKPDIRISLNAKGKITGFHEEE